ncbi:hypothetical protein FACS189419_07480 [Planctomycetales bacterium]|nr:hypothetical protein FACS189419_07480 [Planctomycetales bacterium]
MKRTIFSLALVLALVTSASAQQQRAAQQAEKPLPTLVAVVDLAELVKAHPEFKSKQEALQAQVAAAQNNFKTRGQQIQERSKKLQGTGSGFVAGSPEHQKLLDEVSNEAAEYEKDMKQMERKFALANSRIMYDTYKDIKASLEAFCTERNIAQVTDVRKFEPDPAIPQTVAEDMDQKLVWFNSRLDITQLVIRHMYAARNQTPPAAAQAANPQSATR